jgi:aspartyl-tRNA(Asn)/glutamyl-tRNA(Gln) amidotransferase subunit C
MRRPPFDRVQVSHLATLASLSLGDAEADALAHDLAAIVAYVEELGAVDTSDVADKALPVEVAVWREDVVVPGLSHEDALRGAPRATDAGFAVPGFVRAGPVTGKSG